jgi:hypothetical protein
MLVVSIVHEIMETGVLTPQQENQLKYLTQNFSCSEAELDAIDRLLEALIAGDVVESCLVWGHRAA